MSETTKVVTGLVRFSYLNVWQPKAMNAGDEPKYSASLIIPKSDTVTINKIKRAIAAATEEGKGKWGGKVPANLKMPLRDGDTERPDDETYRNSYFLNANAKTKPGLVDKNVSPILEQSDLYSGAYGRGSVTFYAFSAAGNKGIACGLNHLQKIKDGEPLSGRVAAEVDFSDSFDDDDIM